MVLALPIKKPFPLYTELLLLPKPYMRLHVLRALVNGMMNNVVRLVCLSYNTRYSKM
jgi:hypothetical protein